MKSLLFSFFFFITNFLSAQVPCYLGQSGYEIDFNNNQCLEGIFIDTLSNPDNIWQIGVPDKNVFNNSTDTRAIVTDTLNSYPINDTSFFVITDLFQGNPNLFETFSFESHYKVNTDSLNDFGKIELSVNNENTWYDIIQDNSFANAWISSIPILTGNSNGWKNFHFSIEMAADLLNLSWGDTLKFRFTFISDSLQESMDGLLFNYFTFHQNYFGIEENDLALFASNLYPNPASNLTTITFQNPHNEAFELIILNNLGEEIWKEYNLNQSSNVIDISNLDLGFYTYILNSKEGNKRSTGKLIKSNL